jgi:hypothetical protein
MSIKFTVNDFATSMEILLAIQKQCTSDVQTVAQDAIRIITELCHNLGMDPTTLTVPLVHRLMQAHQDAMNAVKEMEE